MLILLSLLLGFAVTFGLGSSADRAVMRVVTMRQATSPEWLLPVVRFVTSLGDPSMRSLGAILALGVLFFTHRWGRAVVYLVTVAAAAGSWTMMKLFFARTRPDIVPHLAEVSDMSYPSGHAAAPMAVLLLAAFLIDRRHLTVAALMIAIAIGVSRVALGVHWPSDVIGGWLFGAGTALIGAAAASRYAPRIAAAVGPSAAPF